MAFEEAKELFCDLVEDGVDVWDAFDEATKKRREKYIFLKERTIVI